MSSCNNCNTPANSKCAKCMYTTYCSRQCQINDWPKHKSVCIEIQMYINMLCKKLQNFVSKIIYFGGSDINIIVNSSLAVAQNIGAFCQITHTRGAKKNNNVSIKFTDYTYNYPYDQTIYKPTNVPPPLDWYVYVN